MKKEVVIIGAGLAGLAAAYELAKHPEYHITILEARNRIGGRTTCATINGTPVDVGGFIIYPWYKQFHSIVKELGLTKKLKPIPHLDILYATNKDPIFHPVQSIMPSLTTKGLLAAQLLPVFLNNLEVGNPNLTVTKEKTVETFFKTQKPAVTNEHFLRLMDTAYQGYCYPPISTYKAAFMFPLLGNILFFGDITTASYFSQGIETLTHALAHACKKRGVIIQKNTPVLSREGKKILTKKGIFVPDAVIISHPIQEKEIPFTKFLTLTVHCTNPPVLHNKKPFLALFAHPDVLNATGILSIINTEKLYGKKLKNTLTLNILIKEGAPYPKKSPAYEKKIAQELHRVFPAVTETHITSWTPWERTMPQSNESLITKIQEEQGKDGVFYAGDFLGCPSMETAIATGITAAKKVIASTL